MTKNGKASQTIALCRTHGPARSLRSGGPYSSTCCRSSIGRSKLTRGRCVGTHGRSYVTPPAEGPLALRRPEQLLGRPRRTLEAFREVASEVPVVGVPPPPAPSPRPRKGLGEERLGVGEYVGPHDAVHESPVNCLFVLVKDSALAETREPCREISAESHASAASESESLPLKKGTAYNELANFFSCCPSQHGHDSCLFLGAAPNSRMKAISAVSE